MTKLEETKPGTTSTLRADVNEVYLWHGYDMQHEDAIVGSNLNERLASDGGLYGAGLYFAENSCKSNQYCQNHSDRGGQDSSKTYGILLCRVVLGDIHQLSVQYTGREAPLNPAAQQSRPGTRYDSIVACGGGQIHREFIVFNNAQVYPEFIVNFKYT